ncbi:hypothetical protein Poli38472_013215 [Pythium oligandrum]|uniref:Uncharacterized protein n=1 Tax=Pythium oligandrum TaxID=41045 RepID=A0A8K1C2Q1_PYTOL|nr:hypothetical protein Poli38472_013215 [Pythium oligandrum]|eukprot:TMW55324.1 hypothetical protein Poli38472_013215 [Pythium oligandrum]
MAPSFVSPPPVAATGKDQLQRTLSEGARKKLHKRKLQRDMDTKRATPVVKRKKLVMEDTPKKMKTVSGETATRKLEFATTPSKTEKASRSAPVSSASEGEEEEDDDVSSASSDECEVTFDAMTLGNMRVVREAISPVSTGSTASSTTMKPIGLEYRFSVASTVSSIAMAPNGKFLVVGFYNGAIYLYPLTQDALRFRTGVFLDSISARGMYTQLMVRVAIPDDGKFIFAGVYRGSTEIRAFEVDSIELPTGDGATAKVVQPSHDSDSEAEADDEDMGILTAHAITHTYSDAKLKGFSAVKNVLRKSNSSTEYHLLCGLGIKNVHLWRFYRESTSSEWSWECIFDKQSNGISIELLCFHRNFDNQIISKSEHQNIRVWNLEEDAVTGELKKKSHSDVKQTVDATAIYGDHAYGGREALALIDLRSSERMELDLPLSSKEQEAKDKQTSRASTRTSITASMRGRRGRRGGAADDQGNSQRLMRMVSQVAGRDSAPFVVGMCTDGSVFMHNPEPKTIGFATPLEYVEGYEQFFQDPSLSFQAQFSDLTRVNTSGLLAIVPLPKTEKEDWMVVAANAEQLLVRSLKAFLHRNDQDREYLAVKRGLRSAMMEMGNNSSESGSGESSDDSDSDEDVPIVFKQAESKIAANESSSTKKVKSSEKPSIKSILKPNSAPRGNKKSATEDRDVTSKDAETDAKSKSTKTSLESEPSALKKVKRVELPAVSETGLNVPATLAVTPTRRYVGKDIFPSPVVSVSSPSSASSNPNTPERIRRLPEKQRSALEAKEFEWTPVRVENITKLGESALTSKTTEDDEKENRAPTAPSIPVTSKRGRPTKKKQASKTRTKAAQALFTNLDEDAAETQSSASTSSLKRKGEDLSHQQTKKVALDEDDECTDIELGSSEPEQVFASTPLLSDGNSLLAAAMFQYQELQLEAGKGVEQDQFSVAEMNMLTRFSTQEERLRRSYQCDRERILRNVHECDCGNSKRKSTPGSKLNWRKQIVNDVSKAKHMKRRQKKQLVAKLRELDASYGAKVKDMRIIHRLEFQSFSARQEFQFLADQLVSVP